MTTPGVKGVIDESPRLPVIGALWARAKSASWPPLLGVASLVAVASWPVQTDTPGVGLDQSWDAALQMATKRHMDFGSDILFTYGPLGFLNSPTLWYRSLAFFSLVYVFAVTAAFCLALLRVLSRHLHLAVATVATAAVAYSAAAATPPDLLALTAGLVACDLIITRSPTLASWARAMSAAAGLTLVTKFSAGLAMTVTALLVCAAGVALRSAVAVRPKRDAMLPLLQCLALTTLSATAVWVLTGQQLDELPQWLFGGFQLSSGYVEMGLEEFGRKPEYVVALLLAGLNLWLVARHDLPRRVAAVLAMEVLWITFVEGKHGFVRHDGHVVNYFLAMVALPLVLQPPRRERLAGAAVSFAALTALCVAAQRPLPLDLPTRAYSNAITASRQAADILLPARALRVQAEGRAYIRSQVPLDSSAIALLQTGSVQVDPWELSAIWAYDLAYGPVPVIQPYSAYTGWLDDLNANALSGEEAPTFILRGKYDTIDGRLAVWDSPQYQLEQLCRYRLARDLPGWQIMKRTENRCTDRRLLQETTLSADREIAVPAPTGPDVALFATIELPSDWRRTAMAFILKPRTLSVTLNGVVSQRLVERTAAGPHILVVPQSAAEGPGPGGRIGVQRISLHGFRGAATLSVFSVHVRP